ncbi:MAG: hypothetical protein U0893_14905 [Chloroflexota bacterium]
MAGDDRSRLHEIVNEIPEADLPVARQLLELLARGLAAPPRPASPRSDGANGREGTPDATHDDEDDEDSDDAAELSTSPETLARLAQLTDDELVQLDSLLESDRGAARQFWRERFGEDLPDDDLVEDGHA